MKCVIAAVLLGLAAIANGVDLGDIVDAATLDCYSSHSVKSIECGAGDACFGTKGNERLVYLSRKLEMVLGSEVWAYCDRDRSELSYNCAAEFADHVDQGHFRLWSAAQQISPKNIRSCMNGLACAELVAVNDEWNCCKTVNCNKPKSSAVSATVSMLLMAFCLLLRL